MMISFQSLCLVHLPLLLLNMFNPWLWLTLQTCIPWVRSSDYTLTKVAQKWLNEALETKSLGFFLHSYAKEQDLGRVRPKIDDGTLRQFLQGCEEGGVRVVLSQSPSRTMQLSKPERLCPWSSADYLCSRFPYFPRTTPGKLPQKPQDFPNHSIAFLHHQPTNILITFGNHIFDKGLISRIQRAPPIQYQNSKCASL